MISAFTNLDSLSFFPSYNGVARQHGRHRQAKKELDRSNTTSTTSSRRWARRFKPLGRGIQWFWWLPFEQCACCLVWLLSLVCSLVVSGCHQSVTGRRGLHPQLGQPAAAPAGADPVHRADQKGGPGDAVRSASCWRRRWREWVLTEEYIQFTA